MRKSKHTRLTVEANDPSRKGERASNLRIIFGEFHRFAVFAVHTRFKAVEWMVTDAEAIDEVTGGPAVIRQAATMAEAVQGLDEYGQLELALSEVA